MSIYVKSKKIKNGQTVFPNTILCTSDDPLLVYT